MSSISIQLAASARVACLWPHHYAFIVLSYVDLEHPKAEKVDFIVERNGYITKYIQEFHLTLADGLTALGKPLLARLVGELISGEKERVPLQAADLLVLVFRTKTGDDGCGGSASLQQNSSSER